MNVLFGLVIIFHTGIFLLSCSIAYGLIKNGTNPKKHTFNFFSSMVGSLIISLIVVFSVVLLNPVLRNSQIAVLGCTGVPLVPAILAWLSYVFVQIKNRKGAKIEYSLVFWGIVASAPLGFLVGSIYTMLNSL